MAARRVRVAGDREPADDPVARSRRRRPPRPDAADRAQVAALVADAAPAAVARSASPRLAADRLGQRDERVRHRLGSAGRTLITRRRPRDRRGVGRRRRRARRPRRPRRRDAAEVEVAPPPADARRSPRPRAGRAASGPRRPRSAACGSSRWTRGASIASSTPSPCSTTLTITCMIAPRSRTEPALPTTSRGRPRPSDDRRRHHARQPRARPARPASQVDLAEHVVQVDPGARDDHARPRAGGRRERGRVAVGVDDRDVRRRGHGADARERTANSCPARAARRRARRGRGRGRNHARAHATARASPRRAGRSPPRCRTAPPGTCRAAPSPYAISTPPDDGDGSRAPRGRGSEPRAAGGGSRGTRAGRRP